MLKNFSQTLAKAYSAPFSLVSLTDTQVFFKSRVKKSRADKIKYYLANPHKYKRVAKMRVPDLKDPNITFPINIPIKYRFVYRPEKNPPKLPTHDFINFKNMTGNEILLNLSNVEHLRPTELAGALVELTKRPGCSDIDWNSHEYLTKCVEVTIKNLPSYNARTVSTLLYAYHKLRITEPLLWSTLARESNKTIQRIKPRGLGATFVCFTAEPDRCTREYKERLSKVLPIHLKNMNPTLITKCFQLALKENLMTEYLFESHFFQLFWKRNHWFGAANYPAWIKGLVEYGYKTDLEFWNLEFMQSIDKVAAKSTAEEAQKIIDALKEAKESIPELKIESAVETLNNRIVFVNTTLKQVENNKFWNVVKNDIEYYRQKEKLRMEKERTKATA